MAQLSSPGVSVTVIDESFYTPAAPGTVPLIIVASESNKLNAAGTAIAEGTKPANAGKAWLLTSQMDLGNTFGIPYFETDANNNPVNAGELNEYGLQAAYSFLGVSNRAYVVRADLDTAQLKASTEAPTSNPDDGTWWFDTVDTNFGVFQWTANNATGEGTRYHKTPTVITDATLIDPDTSAPLSSVGSVGDYVVVATTTLNQIWFKNTSGVWVLVGTPEWKASWPAASSSTASPALDETHNTLTFKDDTNTTTLFTATGTTIDALVTSINSGGTAHGITAAKESGTGLLRIYTNGPAFTISGNAVQVLGLAPVIGGGYNTSGLYYAPALQFGSVNPDFERSLHPDTVNGYPTGSVWIKTVSTSNGAHWFVKKFNSDTGTWILKTANLYQNNQSALAGLDNAGGGINLGVDNIYIKFNDSESASEPHANFKIFKRTGAGTMSVKSAPITNSTFTQNVSYTFTISESVVGSSSLHTHSITFTGEGDQVADTQAILSALAPYTSHKIATVLNSDGSISIVHTAGGDIRLVDGSHYPLAAMGFVVGTTPNLFSDPSDPTNTHKFLASLWNTGAEPLSGSDHFAQVGAVAPTNLPANNTLWYNSTISEVDIMIHNGSQWVGYANYNQWTAVNSDPVDPNGPIISATMPKAQSDGSKLANGDLWVDTSDLENYPTIYKYNFLTKKWILIDNADQNQIIFHDARSGIDGGTWDANTETGTAPAGTIQQLLTSNFVDFDAPDPALYPTRTLLWNLRRSGNNVVKFAENYVDQQDLNPRQGNEAMTEYYPHRWISAAPNQLDGSGTFGRKAQRSIVLNALNETIQSNLEIRQPDTRIFNLISCPGYLETLSSLIALNNDNGLTAFIVADSPARLTPDATTLNNWGNNVAGAAVDGDEGLIATDAYSAVYYPWGYTTDLTGNNIVVPPSHIMLRTIALSDNVSYPWFAPAGTRRGGVTNASSVGYVDAQSGEFITVALNVGQRDTLAGIHVNPITYIAGTGLVAYGQKTRQLTASSLDRINVARLVVFLRYQLNQLAKPFIFEPNDTITRNEIKQKVEALLLELTGQRALYDYLVVCDTSNNTPARIDRNELHVDIAIEPVKAVEFIYIPLRLENTGAIKGLGK